MYNSTCDAPCHVPYAPYCRGFIRIRVGSPMGSVLAACQFFVFALPAREFTPLLLAAAPRKHSGRSGSSECVCPSRLLALTRIRRSAAIKRALHGRQHNGPAERGGGYERDAQVRGDKREVDDLCGNPDRPIGLEALPSLSPVAAYCALISSGQRAPLHHGLERIEGREVDGGHMPELVYKGSSDRRAKARGGPNSFEKAAPAHKRDRVQQVLEAARVRVCMCV